jgi:hypothetical protein
MSETIEEADNFIFPRPLFGEGDYGCSEDEKDQIICEALVTIAGSHALLQSWYSPLQRRRPSSYFSYEIDTMGPRLVAFREKSPEAALFVDFWLHVFMSLYVYVDAGEYDIALSMLSGVWQDALNRYEEGDIDALR